MTAVQLENPALAPFELTKYKGLQNKNFYNLASLLQHFLSQNIPDSDWKAVNSHLHEFGELAGGRINDLVFAAHKADKYGYLEKYDRHGERIDEIIYCAEQIEAKRLAYNAGILNLDQHTQWQRSFHYEHRQACAYISNFNGEAGYNCPLAMTEGMIEMLTQVAAPEQQKRFLPIVSGVDSKHYFCAGQYLTERVGGSNVSANRTIARKGENGKWYLYGEKWFCSNPSEVWVTTAHIEGSAYIGAFLVSRFKQDGTLNDHHILRKKEIMGTKGKLTVEVEYRGAEAEILGKPHTGLALILRHVIDISRIHTGVSAAGIARRAYLEAREYIQTREAFGKKIREFASVRTSLLQMQLQLSAAEIVIFNNWSYRINKDPIASLLTPLMKYKMTSLATHIVHKAIMLHGGNGIVEDYSLLPRLYTDSIINETWEGTHNIIAKHVLKAFFRPKIKNRYLETLENASQSSLKIQLEDKQKNSYLNDISAFLSRTQKELDGYSRKGLSEANYLPMVDKIFTAFSLSLFVEEAKKLKKPSIFGKFLLAYYCLIKNPQDALIPEESILLDENVVNELINY